MTAFQRAGRFDQRDDLITISTCGDKTVFKGGTSLSKGWNLSQRFSEDVDFFLDPLAFTPALGKNASDRELKKLRNAVGAHLTPPNVPSESRTFRGIGRDDRFAYRQRFDGHGEVADRVLLEARTVGGKQSTTVALTSFLAQFLKDIGVPPGDANKYILIRAV